MPNHNPNEYDDSEYRDDDRLPARREAEPPAKEEEDRRRRSRATVEGEAEEEEASEEEAEYIDAEWSDVEEDEEKKTEAEQEGGESLTERAKRAAEKATTASKKEDGESLTERAKRAAEKAAAASKKAGSKTAEASKRAGSAAAAGTSRAAGATKTAYGEAKGGAKAYMEHREKMAEKRPAPAESGPPAQSTGMLEGGPPEGPPDPGIRAKREGPDTGGYGRTRDEPTPEMMMGFSGADEPRDGIVGPGTDAVMFTGVQDRRPVDNRSRAQRPMNEAAPETMRRDTPDDLMFGFGFSSGVNAPDVSKSQAVAEDGWMVWGGSGEAMGGGMLDFGSGQAMGGGTSDFGVNAEFGGDGEPRNDFGVGGWL